MTNTSRPTTPNLSRRATSRRALAALGATAGVTLVIPALTASASTPTDPTPTVPGTAWPDPIAPATTLPIGPGTNPGTVADPGDLAAPDATGACGEWSTGDPNAPCGPGQTITFAPGTSSFLFDGGIYDATQVWYFHADAGQALELDLQAADDDIDAVLFAPDGTSMLPADYVDGTFDGTLPADGVYSLVLTATAGGPYGLGIAIDAPEPLAMGSYDRIAFAPGTDSGTVSGAVDAGTFDTWLFNADAGQDSSLALAASDVATTFTLLDNTGEPLADEVLEWNGELPNEGFYTIIVASPESDADYELDLTIPDGQPDDSDVLPKELFFAPGSDSGSFHGELTAGASSGWVLWAAAGQTATFASTGDPVTMAVYSPSGEELAVGGEPGTDMVAELPADGLYGVYVWAPLDAPASYSVDVTIPDRNGDGDDGTIPDDSTVPDDGNDDDGDGGGTQPDEPGGDTGGSRVEFPAGDDTAAVEGALEADSWHTYLLAAEAGQELYASVISTNGTVTMELRGPDGERLAGAGTELSATLPVDGDYRLVVGTADTAEEFSFDVAIY